MSDHGKRNVLGVLVDAIDCTEAGNRIIEAAKSRKTLGVSALAVHGVMTGVLDRAHRYRLNHLELVTPDGQPVRWALNLLYRVGLSDTVRGVDLTLHVLERAEAEKIPVYFYGSRQRVLDLLLPNLQLRFPGLIVAGAEPSKFRRVTPEEQEDIVERIVDSGAQILFVGLGCPRQEVFVYELRERLHVPALAVGAVFDYLAGLLRQPPHFVRRAGLEWLWRLSLEPRRLWRRYVFLNPAYLTLLALQLIRAWRPDPTGSPPTRGDLPEA